MIKIRNVTRDVTLFKQDTGRRSEGQHHGRHGQRRRTTARPARRRLQVPGDVARRRLCRAQDRPRRYITDDRNIGINLISIQTLML